MELSTWARSKDEICLALSSPHSAWWGTLPCLGIELCFDLGCNGRLNFFKKSTSIYINIFFFKEFQPMTSALDNNFFIIKPRHQLAFGIGGNWTSIYIYIYIYTYISFLKFDLWKTSSRQNWVDEISCKWFDII